MSEDPTPEGDVAYWRYAAKAIGVSMLDFFRGELGDQVVDVAFVCLAEAYIVWEARDGRHTCLIAKVVFDPRDRQRLRYYLRNEDEAPPFTRCPEKVLKQLDEPATSIARRWRNACRDHHAHRAEKPTLHDGDWVLFLDSRRLGSDHYEHLFRVNRYGRSRRRHVFYPAGDRPGYRLRRFRDATWYRITCRADVLDLLQHDNRTIREQAMRLMGLVDFDEDGDLLKAA